MSHLADARMRRLDEMSVPDVVTDRLRRALHARREHARERLNDSEGRTESADHVCQQLRRGLIHMESAELQRLYDDHRISATTRCRLQRSLDREEARLADT
ncbi:hypothetical protein ACFXKR_38860 [Streptomyces violascens]|uniref:hypothetical protein n=1 Tax=Streptomyces violascens TaxID=67381 RepID=UPI0036A10AC6